MYSDCKECDSQLYLKIMDIMENGNRDFGYNIIIHEPVSGVSDAITYLLKNVGQGEVKSAIDHIFSHYKCKIRICLTNIMMLGSSVYEIDVNLMGIPKGVCKKLIGLKKIIKCVVKDSLHPTNKKSK